MKCWVHPKVDAVAVCVSCGKGLCKECSIVMAGNNYCKTCVESEKWKAPPTPLAPPPPPTAPPTPPPTPVKVEPTPTPTGVPSRAQFIVGGVGSILNTIASIPMFIFVIALWISIIAYYEEYTYLYPILAVGVVGFILLIIGIIMAAIGYSGFRRNYGSGMGTASFAFAIIVTVLLIIIAFVDITLIYAGEPYYEYEYTARWVIAFVGQIIWFLLFGLMQILWGATHIVSRKFTGHSGLSLATGIMLIIAGSLTTTFVITSIGIALFFVAQIMASILFFISEVPTVSKS